MKPVIFSVFVAFGFVLASCGNSCPSGYNTTDPSCPGYVNAYGGAGYQQPSPYGQPQPTYYPGQQQPTYYPGQQPGYPPQYPGQYPPRYPQQYPYHP